MPKKSLPTWASSLALLAFVLNFLGMTNSERVEAVCNELFNADVWVGDNIKSSKVAAFIVERDVKRDSAWAEYASARAAYSLTMAEHDYDERRVEVESATLNAAKRALRDLGVDVDAPTEYTR